MLSTIPYPYRDSPLSVLGRHTLAFRPTNAAWLAAHVCHFWSHFK